MRKGQLINFIILVLVFIVCISFPSFLKWVCPSTSAINNDIYVIRYCKIGCYIAFLIFAILFIHFTGLSHLFQGKRSLVNGLLLLPIFAVAFCNLFYLTVVNGSHFGNPKFDGLFFLDVAVSLLAAVSEEIVFRFVLQKNIIFPHRLIRILIAAAIFSAVHFVCSLPDWFIDPSIIPNELIKVAYTFGIGIILGFLYEYTNNIVWPVAFHVIYNFINTNLFSALHTGDIGFPYYINSICFAAFAAIYLCVFYFVFLKREYR